MRSILFWAAFPFVLRQALRVRKTAPRFAAAAGPTEGSVGTGRELSLLAIGDSIIAGVGAGCLTAALVGQTARALAAALGARINWTARGRSGARSNDVLNDLVPQLAAAAADCIVLSVGVNDVTGLTSLSKWERNLTALIERLSEHSPGAAIAVAGIPPLGGFPLLPQPLRAVFGVRARSFDLTARRVVARFPQAIHVPIEIETTPEKFSADGFHPSESGYRHFGRTISERIAQRMGATARANT